MPVFVLIVVLFHVEAASCGFVAVAFAKPRSGLQCITSTIPVACVCACAVSCLQLLLAVGLQVFLNLGLQLNAIACSVACAVFGL